MLFIIHRGYTTMATRTKVDGNKLLSVVLEGLKNSKNSWYSSANKHTNRRSVSIESLFSKMLVKKAPRFRNGILNCGEFFRPSRTTCCHRLFQAIARYRAQQQASSCSLANTWCIIIFTTTNTYLHVNPKMRFITY